MPVADWNATDSIVDVYLPASYASGVNYPVVYLQDGQNLSDPAIAFAGTWELEAAIDRLAWRGIEAIVVGVPNAGRHRLAEYSPCPDPRHGGGHFARSEFSGFYDRHFTVCKEPMRVFNDHNSVVNHDAECQ